MPATVLISSSEMESQLRRVLLKQGFAETAARTCADIFTTNSVDGVYSHGINRFVRFIEGVKAGYIQPNIEPVRKSSTGSIEQWDGQMGPGPINALRCTERSMELAREYGMGCVALANTNHWMRGGTYGWKAAKAGFIFIGWTNTIANMPTWGAKNSKLGNNPLILAIPYQDEAIVLDMAMSQYSYGALEVAELKKEKLAVAGGYDEHGHLSNDPTAIKKSQRVLPIGYWKGAGLSLLLDILGTVLAGGLSTSQISQQGVDKNQSQVFITIDLSKLSNFRSIATVIDQIIMDYQQSLPAEAGKKIRYPGENILRTREENHAKGIPVLKAQWEEIMAM
jgi:3-dehydro-L-gulonate 2-dehydrogenase